MTTPQIAALHLLLFSSLSTFIGCSGDSDLPDTVAAGGTVTYKGEPVAGAQVVFRVEGGRPATGITGPDGRFALSTFGDQDGAIPGDHVVTVVKTLKVGVSDGSTDPSQADTMEEAAAASDRQKTAGAQENQSIIPTRYSNPETSRLEFTVKDGVENDFDVTLVD